MTTPQQAAKDGIVHRLIHIFPSMSLDEMVAKSGLPDHVPVAVDELVVEGKIEYVNGRYVMKGRR